ncbi:MAG: ABC transporter permease, partial [Bacteroidales bacterium]|nr:ABC transporter permease [Bacteroidales bacterium]
MISFFNISTVSRFESKTLFRSWFFRIFAIIILGFILMFNIFGVAAVADGGWPGRVLPSGAPYFNMWLLNIAQAIIAVFLAADFLGRDKKLDTTEAFYVRSMSNVEYVIGKTFGVLKVFVVLNILVLLSALLFSLIGNEAPINWSTYIYYPLIISLPTLVFILGLSFFTMTLIRNQAVTFVLLLGFIALSLFYLGNKHFRLFDVLGFYTSFMRSDFTGFQHAYELIQHRMLYLVLGVAFIFATIWRLPRLEQQKLSRPVLMVGILALIGVSGLIVGNIIVKSNSSRSIQEHIIQLNDQLTTSDYVIESSDIELKHQQLTIQCVASMQVAKIREGNKELKLVLNPGLNITACSVNSNPVSYKRDAHIISIDTKILKPDNFTLELSYEGGINDDAMYPDINEETRMAENRLDPLLAGKQYSFIQDNYVLLTREAGWYPVIASKQYWVSYPFTAMNLKVNTKPGLEIITQGKKDSLGLGSYRFMAEKPLNAYSLIIGDYERHTTLVDSIEFNLYHHKNHVFYKDYFTEIGDTVSHVIKNIKDDFERKLGVNYPFERFSVVETPVNFYSYLRNWSLATESVMPEMVLFPESGGGTWQNDLDNVRRRIDRRTDRSNEERSEKDLQVEVFKNYVGDNFISPSRFFFGRRQEGERHVENWGRRQVFPLYFTYSNRIVEDGYPLLTIAVENYLHKRLSEERRRDLGGLSSNDEVILKLRDNSLKELIDKEDVNTLGNVFASKGSQLFSNLKVNVGQTSFDSQLDELISDTRFTNKQVSDFNRALSGISNTDFNTIYSSWLNETYNAAFLFSSVDVFEVKEGNRMRYFLKVTVANNGDADGIVSFTVREGMQRGGRGRFRSRFQMDAEQDNQQSYQIKAGNTYDIGFLLDEEPRDVTVNTFLAANIPSNQTLTLNDVNRNSRKVNFFEGPVESGKKLRYNNPAEVIVDNEDEGFEVI